MNRLLATIGIVGTGGYLIAMIATFGSRLSEVHILKLNEVGDLMAGVFGPIAVLWLILGFFQQGIELRQSGKALKLQAEELKNSVEQQRALVEVSRAQVQAEHERLKEERVAAEQAARAKLWFKPMGSVTSGGTTTHEADVSNYGAVATQLRIVAVPPLKLQTQTDIAVLTPGPEFRFRFQFENGHPLPEDRLVITYRDVLGRHRREEFLFETMNGVFSAIVPA